MAVDALGALILTITLSLLKKGISIGSKGRGRDVVFLRRDARSNNHLTVLSGRKGWRRSYKMLGYGMDDNQGLFAKQIKLEVALGESCM